MTEGHNRVRIVVGETELEVEGDADFIGRFDDSIAAMLEALSAGGSTEGGGKRRAKRTITHTDDGDFGELLHALPKDATGTDQMLLAGRFAQLESDDKSFATKDAASLLLEQSIKIGNPSQCMTNNLKAKRVFKVGDRYRVSKSGEEYLDTLTAS
ncbi:MAG: hypothetical protein JWO37_283 [Acidimicrobiales bacterium]|jgi:hypothetical protein|nr:hypothetical protein [Acidimicrobiales bacterium]